MDAQQPSRRARMSTRARSKPGLIPKRLPWLDGRSSIASSSLNSPPGRVVTPKQVPDVSPLSRQPIIVLRDVESEPESSPSEPINIRRSSVAQLLPTSDVSNILYTVPDHLVDVESPESVIRPVQRVFHAPTPEIVASVQRSPDQPIPRPSIFERHGQRKLSHAIEGLEELVEDAIITAEYAERPEHVQEIYAIIEEASATIQDASVESGRRLMETLSPLPASSEEVSQYLPFETGAFSTAIMATTAHTTTQRKSETIDWAYRSLKDIHHRHKHNHRCSFPSTSTSSSSSSLRSRGRRQCQFSSGSDLLQLLPPGPAVTAARDHIDHVLRPRVSRSHSRGRSRRRKANADTCRRRHRHHRRHRSCLSDDAKSRSPNRHRHRHYKSADPSQFDTSFDEEDLPAAGKPRGIRRYGEELHVGDSVRHHTFSLRRHHRQQPIARNWRTAKKRISAFIACANTAVLGIIVGIYAGEVPRIQYMLADESHRVIIGNVVLYCGLALSTFLFWPLPLLHGRKPWILGALALAMPLQFPQALVVSQRRSPTNANFRVGLLIARTFTGVILGFANVNFISVLLDLFGASLQSKHPHQEVTVPNDVRRHGGGMGMWLGLWSWCWIGSLAGGFQIGAGLIDSLTPDWGFYITIIILAVALVVNVMAPETRRSAYRRSVTEVYDRDEHYITRRVARGEIKLHLSTEGPKYWFEEVWAGLKLSTMMLCQPGFLVLSIYLAWIYAQIMLVIVLLGSLLSRDYKWHSQYVGLGVMSIAIGALLAIPLTKAGIFSRERKKAFRTDSMTFQKEVSWSSHLIRRCIFTLVLPLMGLAYTVSSAGRPKPFMVPIVFAAAVGFLSVLAIAECHGLIMETFDTCDLQPGVNTRHRLQSMAMQDRRRRTNYSSFPRVSAGIFAAQSLAFVGAAVATEVGGIMTRHIGAQASTGVTAGILLVLTLLLTLVLWRFKEVQVIPNHTFGTRRDTQAWQEFKELENEGRGSEWKAVVIGNPSGKMRRMSVLELGALSRWTEIRKLNFLIRGKDRSRKRDDWHQGGS